MPCEYVQPRAVKGVFFMSFDPYEFDRSMVPEGQLETIGQYTAKTFLWMVLGLMITFGVAIVCWITDAISPPPS